MSAQIIDRTEAGFTVQITIPYNQSMLEFERSAPGPTQCRRSLGHSGRTAAIRHRRLTHHGRLRHVHEQGATPQGLGDRRLETYPDLGYPPAIRGRGFVGWSISVSPSGRATLVEDSVERFDTWIRSGARRLTGYPRRSFQAEVATELCGGSARQAERRFGWGRDTVEQGLHELHHGVRSLENFAARGRQRREQKDPQLAADIRAIVEPHTDADPELKSARR